MGCLPEHTAPEEMPNLVDMTHQDLEDYFRTLGHDRFRATQVMKWIHQGLLGNFEGMTNLSKTLRVTLAQRARMVFPEHVTTMESSDGTKKFLLRLDDGQTIETVIIPGDDHDTLCVSTQVGCAMGCRICRTARMGLKRNLTPGEIASQLLAVRKALPGSRITNMVFMGMGEPLSNFLGTVNAVRILTHPNGPGISWRHLTISTVGLVPRMHQLANEVRVKLAISLNAVTDEQRDAIMPINRQYPLADLLAAARTYPLPRRDRITFEYVLIDNFNDSDADARQLVRLLNKIKAKVNLIPLNDDGLGEFRSPKPERVRKFQDILMSKSLTAIIRKSRGRDILAACGQLAAASGH
jgi:23S rRNA (adenine2503-C2)-methyltransferase